MGRAKLKMELIPKEKTRNSTFQKRKTGIFKKANEFSILCDVDTLLIIYPPNSSKPEIWPENPEKIKKIISSYKSKNGENGKKCYDLKNFFLDRKKQIEDELSKARKKNIEAKYATWSEELDRYPEHNLRQLAMQLENKENLARNVLEIKKQSMFRNYMGSGLNCGYNPGFQEMDRGHYGQIGWLENGEPGSFLQTVKCEPAGFGYQMVYDNNMMNQWAYQQAMLQGGQIVPDFVMQEIRSQLNNGV